MGLWDLLESAPASQRVTKCCCSGSVLERRAEEGNGPVRETTASLSRHPSSTGPVKPGVNLRGPSRKAKYP